MARGGKQKSNVRKSRKQHSRNSKGPSKKKFKVNKSDDTSTVGGRFKGQQRSRDEAEKVAVEEDASSVGEESEEEKTALDELLSTFGNETASKNKPVDSESDLDSESEEDSDESEEGESEEEDTEQVAGEEFVDQGSEPEDSGEETEETLKDAEKNYLKHYEVEFDEEKMKKILSKSERNCVEIKHPYLGAATFASGAAASPPSWDGASGVLGCLSAYTDLMMCDRARIEENELVSGICAHVLRHVLRSRAKILHHTAKLKANEMRGGGTEMEYRDQGLTRPKVLIVLPFRSRAVRYVTEMMKQMGEESTVMNKARFFKEFDERDEEAERKLSRKPLDHQQMFGGGSADESFRLGISLKRKCVRLYAPFYSSDILLCSPVGLRLATASDTDFLSSVELLVLDECHVMQMQNWEHVQHLGAQMHLRPTQAHGVDFSRVRRWALEEGWAKAYRQTLAFSNVRTSELVSFFNKFCFNHAGLLSCHDVHQGDILRVAVQLPQTFQRFQASSVKEDAEERFRFFTEIVLPQYKSDMLRGTLIFIPSYFDYVRVRNHFRKQDVSFVQVCEYTEAGKTAEARDKFFHRYRKFLLYTERAHFYNRYVIKGIRHLLFYQLPLLPRFYSELCNQLGSGSSEATCSVLISRYDSFRLAGVVGHDRACKILSNANKVHLLVSGDI